MPLTKDEISNLEEQGYTNVKPFDPAEHPEFAQRIRRFSEILGRQLPYCYVADFVGPEEIKKLGLKTPLTSAYQTKDSVIISNNCFSQFTGRELAAVFGHELIHYHENHILVYRAANIIAGTATAFAALKIARGAENKTSQSQIPQNSPENPDADSTDKTELRPTRRGFGRYLATLTVSGSISLASGSVASHYTSNFIESRADLVSAELFGTGEDLISAFRKLAHEDRLIANEIQETQKTYEPSLLMRYEAFISYHPSLEERIADLEALVARKKHGPGRLK